MRSRHLAITLGLAFVLISLVLIAPRANVAARPDAPATTRNYPGSAPCSTTLQACISGSTAGDVINIAANTYITNQINITRSITLQGAGPSSTILQANSSHGVIVIGSSIAAGVVISNLAVISGTATNGGGIDSGSGTPLTLQNVNVLSNTATTNGGGVYATSGITLTNVNFINNKATGGLAGGLRANAGAVVNGGRFEHNTTLNGGGAIQAGSFLTLSDVIVLSNTSTSATFNGGGIRADGSLFIQNGLVENNVSGNDGGGISAASAIISNTSIISNAGNDGGGLLVTGNLAITNTLLDKNTARTGNGGAIYASNSGVTITLEGTSGVSQTIVSDSKAITNGGGIYAAGNVVLIGNVSFNSNKATEGDGGGLYANSVSDASGGLVNPTVQLDLNSANINGGGIRALGDVSLKNFPQIVGNHTLSNTGNGGGIYADGNITIVSGLSQANSAHNGGIIYAGGNASIKNHAGSQSNANQDGGCVYAVGNLEALNDEFFRCNAGGNGGVFFAGQTVTITEDYIGTVIQTPGYQQNTATRGGLVYGSKVALQSLTPFSNTALIEGGAVYAAARADISATTFSSNTAGYYGGSIVVSGTALITNSIFTSNKITNTNGFGGAVWVTGTIDISNSTFLSNTAAGFTSNGGGIGATGRIRLWHGAIQGNQAVTGAGVRGLADVVVTGTTFTSNGGVNDRLGGGIAAITTTLTGVTMTGNNVCCTDASGGAISTTIAFITGSMFIQNSAFISGGAVLASQVFITNSQFISNSEAGEGAGVWTKNGGVITNSIFSGNSTGCCSDHRGGAVYSRGQIFIDSSQFNHNESDTGGAIFMQGNGSEIYDSQFDGNFVSCCGGGGALYTLGFGPNIHNTTFTNNHVDCCGDGGAISADSYLFAEYSNFQNNRTNTGSGGAIFIPTGISAASDITVSTFVSNSATQSGGAIDAQNVNINSSTFISNAVDSSASGGAVNIHNYGDFNSDVFQANHVTFTSATCLNGNGGALAGDSASFLTIQQSSFARNSAYNGGAIFAGGTATIDNSSFNDNSVKCLEAAFSSNIGYGGAILGQDDLTIRRSSFIRNSAGSIGGGAIFYQPSAAKTLRVENSLFARNIATNTVFSAAGAAIGLTNTNTTQLFYNTFANGPTKNSVSAIMAYSGVVSIIDNIITNHALGIRKSPIGTVSENFNLFFNNTANTGGGVASGGSSLTNTNPLFVDAGADAYHLSSNSLAINAATDLGITEDYDSDTRPNGGGFDIGFDEWTEGKYKVYLPLVLRH